MIEVIVPIFGIVGLGYTLTRLSIFSETAGQGLTQFMFYVAIPAMLFQSVSSTLLPAQMPFAYWGAFYLPSFLIFALAMLAMRFAFRWPRNAQGIAGVTASYSNMVLLGLPLLLAAYGDDVKLPLFILLAVQSLLLFPTTILAVEVFGADANKQSVKNAVAKKLLLNPIILSLLIGLSANLLGYHASGSLLRSLEIIGAAAPACALIALGISLAQYKLEQIHLESICLACLKTFVHPLLVYLACKLLGVESFWMQVAVFLAAMPCGINAFIFASNYQIKTEIVTQSIVLSTLMSVLSSAILLYLFKSVA